VRARPGASSKADPSRAGDGLDSVKHAFDLRAPVALALAERLHGQPQQRRRPLQGQIRCRWLYAATQAIACQQRGSDLVGSTDRDSAEDLVALAPRAARSRSSSPIDAPSTMICLACKSP